ncbi:MAG: HK97 family phage prohead protease, partial [Planctomycetota bacterium]|nr:HK97 family phage prohead protease [Planctomycetota bacterium]
MPHPKTTETLAPLHLTCTMQIEAADGPDAKAALPRFRMIAYTGGPMRVAGWRYPVIVDLSGLTIPSQNRPIRLGHDAAQGIGHTDSIRVDGGQLLAGGVVSRDTSAAKEVVASSRNGFPWQASIGASVEEAEFVKENQKAVVNGQEVTGPVNVIRKASLGEISFVDLGADGRTSASVAATAKEEHRTVENNAKAGGEVTAAQEPQPQPTQSAPETPAATIRAEAAAESARIAAIRKLCGGKFAELETQAIRDGWDATRCELELLRASRPKAPAVLSGSDNGLTSAL